MVKKVEGGYKCSICGTLHDRDTLAVGCEKSHEVIYVPIRRDDLFRLIQYIYTKDDSLISKTLMETLSRYKKGSYV